ncbi:RlpA-like double-psi beta-barrel-protein domain-containing protein-containing protein [Halteromyces radiatus]|uniref:RlpA-like double-psi beta-barrel-protein domain-containing protein-containing protein n=1 Tax=Halteromyces radiatus TaxID=101107 RepID=UPI0022204864|nr:RlpA-like double-psi beta-barrel-protein domain-containing protein-containing protein [Halteromyces radiatus]KAI8096764.1 RlpA-like double-psi beta-barrel-protein domain-containing protein-containing protein [Halteromyces radiatus]
MTIASPSLEKREFTGEGTYYNVGLGSCGKTNDDHQYVAALNAPQMNNGPNPNYNKLCDKRIRVTGPKGTITVKIVDTCPPCKSGDVDLSPSSFAAIADLSAGRVPITWSWA